MLDCPALRDTPPTLVLKDSCNCTILVYYCFVVCSFMFLFAHVWCVYYFDKKYEYENLPEATLHCSTLQTFKKSWLLFKNSGIRWSSLSFFPLVSHLRVWLVEFSHGGSVELYLSKYREATIRYLIWVLAAALRRRSILCAMFAILCK